MKRKCCYCNQEGGKGPRELRPYGPDGADVCAECVFTGPPEREELARGVYTKQLAGCGEVALLDPSEQVGPRPIKSEEA